MSSAYERADEAWDFGELGGLPGGAGGLFLCGGMVIVTFVLLLNSECAAILLT